MREKNGRYKRTFSGEKLATDISEWLDTYKVYELEELVEVTRGFDESRLIQGSVYRGMMDGEVYTIKKMKWNACDELKILQKIQNLEREIQEKSAVKGFELELKTANNRILQEQLQQKCAENNQLQEQILLLQQQMNSMKTNMQSLSAEQVFSIEIDKLKSKSKYQEAENKKLSQEQLQLIEENRRLVSQSQKLADEAAYAKELASAVELKNLASAAAVELKGHGIYAFVTSVEGVPYSEELKKSLTLTVRKQWLRAHIDGISRGQEAILITPRLRNLETSKQARSGKGKHIRSFDRSLHRFLPLKSGPPNCRF